MGQEYLTLLLSLLIGGLSWLAYALGKKVVKEDEYKRKEKAVAEARKARALLDCGDYVERLHDKFRR